MYPQHHHCCPPPPPPPPPPLLLLFLQILLDQGGNSPVAISPPAIAATVAKPLRQVPAVSGGGMHAVSCRRSAGGGRRGRRSCAYVACSTPGEGAWVWDMELDDSSGGSNSNGRDGDGVVQGEKGVTRPRRLCPEEKCIMSNAVLIAMVCCPER